jgi:hypothetical protein
MGTDVSEEHIACIIRVKNLAVPSLLIFFTLMMEAIRSFGTLFLQEQHSITSQKTAFFTIADDLPIQ